MKARQKVGGLGMAGGEGAWEGLLRYELEGVVVERYASRNLWQRRYHRRRFRLISEILSRVEGRELRFLDCGCGSGEYLEFSEALGWGGVGVDVSGSYLRRARALTPDALLVQGDVSSLPFRDGVFDVVLCSEVIEHVRDPQRLAAELFRVGSRLVMVTTPNMGLLRRWSRRISLGFVSSLDRSVGHLRVFFLSDMVRLLSDIGAGWRLVWGRTRYIVPPVIPALFRIPGLLERVAAVFERFLDRVLPLDGNVSFVVYVCGSGRKGVGVD